MLYNNYITSYKILTESLHTSHISPFPQLPAMHLHLSHKLDSSQAFPLLYWSAQTTNFTATSKRAPCNHFTTCCNMPMLQQFKTKKSSKFPKHQGYIIETQMLQRKKKTKQLHAVHFCCLMKQRRNFPKRRKWMGSWGMHRLRCVWSRLTLKKFAKKIKVVGCFLKFLHRFGKFPDPGVLSWDLRSLQSPNVFLLILPGW